MLQKWAREFICLFHVILGEELAGWEREILVIYVVAADWMGKKIKVDCGVP